MLAWFSNAPHPAVLARSPATSYADIVTKTTASTDERFQAVCKQLYGELLNPESPLFTGRLVHPSYPDTPEVRELYGAPSILVPFQNTAFFCINWHASWANRFKELAPLRELAAGRGHFATIAAQHLEVYDSQQFPMQEREVTVAFSNLSRGAAGRGARGRSAEQLVRDVGIGMLDELFSACGLRGRAKSDAMIRFFEIVLPDAPFPKGLRKNLQRTRRRFGALPDEEREETPFADENEEGELDQLETDDVSLHRCGTPHELRVHDVQGPIELRRLPEWFDELPEAPVDEVIGLLRGPISAWPRSLREEVDTKHRDVMMDVEARLEEEKGPWHELAEGLREAGIGLHGFAERLVESVSWYAAAQSILESYRNELHLWQKLIQSDGPTATDACEVLEHYGRWALLLPGTEGGVRLLRLFDAFREGDQTASIGTGLDSIAVVLIRRGLPETLRTEQCWDLVDEMLGNAREPHRWDDARCKVVDPLHIGEQRLSGLGPESLKVYHFRGVKVLRSLGVIEAGERGESRTVP